MRLTTVFTIIWETVHRQLQHVMKHLLHGCRRPKTKRGSEMCCKPAQIVNINYQTIVVSETNPTDEQNVNNVFEVESEMKELAGETISNSIVTHGGWLLYCLYATHQCFGCQLRNFNVICRDIKVKHWWYMHEKSDKHTWNCGGKPQVCVCISQKSHTIA